MIKVRDVRIVIEVKGSDAGDVDLGVNFVGDKKTDVTNLFHSICRALHPGGCVCALYPLVLGAPVGEKL